MATQHVTPDYDRCLEPREIKVPDDHLQCIECGYIVAAEVLTELESELEVCSERCAVKVIKDMNAAARRANEQAGRDARTLQGVYSILSGIRATSDAPNIFYEIGRAMGTAKVGVN